MRRTISILGSTGSIGTQSLEVIAAHHHDLDIAYLTTNTNVDLLAQQVQHTAVHGVAIRDENACKRFKEISDFKGEILVGEEGLLQVAAYEENSLLISALVGFSGVRPTLAAVQRGTTVALANKETLVSAGRLITEAAKKSQAKIIAVDSEHSAILQCLVGEEPACIEKLYITASGGPFRRHTQKELETVTVDQALQHPNWTMGAKITIDSATLMNKGFEVIEARWLFDIAPQRIDVLVHPQSIIHSMVQFIDGSIKAQMGLPSMNLPIHYALNFPQRVASNFVRLDFSAYPELTFERPDLERFPCLKLAYDAMAMGGTATAVLNAANEVAVAKFLRKKIRFDDISRIIDQCLDAIPVVDNPSLEDIIASDRLTRERAMAFTTSTFDITN